MLASENLSRKSSLDRGASDVGIANLICAEGLPGGASFDIGECIRIRDEWTQRVRHETDRLLYVFRRQPESYGNSEAQFRMMVFVTVLQRDFGVHYHDRFKAMPDSEFFARPEHLFAHGVLLKREGTCSSLPPTFASIGRQLGYPLKMVTTCQHRFLRWDSPRGERFNIECTSQGLVIYPDEHYLQWPQPLSAEQIRRYRSLKSLSPKEEMAYFIGDRAHVFLEHQRFAEASFEYARACQTDIENWGWSHSLTDAMNRWKIHLHAMMMLGFPALTITFPPRRFPLIPLDLERGLVHMAVKEDLLRNSSLNEKWWEPLRRNPKPLLPDLPTHIAVRFTDDPRHPIQYRFDRKRPDGFKPDQPT